MSNLPLLRLFRSGRVWRTLRFRLAAWNAAVVVITAVITLIGLRQGVRWALVHELDQILMDDAQGIALEIASTQERELPRLQSELSRRAQGHERQGWYVTLLDQHGEVVWASPGGSPDQTRMTVQDSSVRQVPITLHGDRIVERRLNATDSNIASVRVGATLDLIQQDMARIDRGVLLATGAVLLVAPLCGYFLAARAAQTLGEIIATASRLRPSRLDERLRIRGSGDELDMLAQTINGLLDRIAAYLDTKRDFLANAAHELRTPLAAVRSSIEVALNSNRSPEEYEELMIDVIEECSVLETLVNQLLLLSEAEAELPATRFEVVALEKLTLKSIEMFTGVAEGQGVALRAGTLAPAPIVGNPEHLRQVLNNLIDNAVKYAVASGEVLVELAVDKSAANVQLTVKDNGPGISRHEQRLIFERFYRAESARTRTGVSKGAGLGLSICQSVVHNHGGTIQCLSQPNRGTTFIVVLPLYSELQVEPRDLAKT